MTTFTLESLSPLLGLMATERAHGDRDLRDTLRQEGLVAAWRVMESRPDASRAYVTASARRAMGDVLRGRPLFGQESHRGRREPMDTASPYTLTAEDEDDFAGVLADVAAAQALLRVEMADVEAEVREAVDELAAPDAAIVTLRFWEGMEWAEIGRRLDLPASTAQRRWGSHARPALAARLGFLREEVAA